MLKRLTTKNFRKLVDNTFDFGPGLQVVRGANEAGKTTMLEAIAYALGGVKACREPLADVVTWGQAEKTLRVTLSLTFDGVEYTVGRHKNGAEVNYAGGRVVGQDAVTTFFERLFGCDMSMMGKLMIASQGAIRGALETGSKETMHLIEGLADFQIVDRVIELIGNNLVTGPTATAEDRVNSAQAAFAAAQAASVAPDTLHLDAKIAGWSTGIKLRQQKIDKELKPAFEKAQAEVQKAEVAAATRKSLQNQAAGIVGNKAQRQAQLREATKTAENGVDPRAIEVAREAVKAAENVAAELVAYNAYQKLALPMVHWEGDEASFVEEHGKTVVGIDAGNALVASLQREIRDNAHAVQLLLGQRVTGSACGYCSKDVSGIPEVVAKNAKIDIEISTLKVKEKVLRSQLAIADAGVSEASQSLMDLNGVSNAAKPFLAFLARYADKVQVSNATFPPALKWTAPIPDENVNVAGVKRFLANLELAANTAFHAKAKADALTETIAQYDAEIDKLAEQIGRLTLADKLPDLQAALEVAQDAYNEASGEISAAKYEISLAEAEIRRLQDDYARSKQAVAGAHTAAERAEADLKALVFNNALLKRVRAARPVIADKLWTLVLSTVSAYFSAMRGSKSVVTRSGNEFLVDGKTIKGYSGSTLDVLGLALRVALTRTFLPNTPLLTLDEPASAMDEDRTAATMGFLTAAGFPQTIVVTHEDATESVAQNLITL